MFGYIKLKLKNKKVKKRYLQFKGKKGFSFEVRDIRFRNTFFVNQEGVVEKIYFPIGDDTSYKIGDQIDFKDYNHIYISHETRREMDKFPNTKSFTQEHFPEFTPEQYAIISEARIKNVDVSTFYDPDLILVFYYLFSFINKNII